MDGTLLTADCLERLGLTQQPFLPQWQPAFGFADTSLDMPLNVTLEHLRDTSPPVLIKGEYGIGKSTQLKRLMARGDDLHFCLIEAEPDTSMAAVDYAVRLQWQPHPRHGEPKKLSLDRYLAALCEDGMRPVLLVDDAHHLEPKVLGTLLNLKQHMRNKLGQTLGVVLTGERSIDDTLALLEGKLRIVDELYAISTRPLNREQTAQYIQHRLEAAGRLEAMPLDADALDAIQQQTGGLPRDVNAAAVAALQSQCELGASGRKTVAGLVGERRKGLPGRLLMPVAIVLVVIGLLASLYGLIAGLLGTADKSETALQGESTGAKLAIPAPTTESTAPSPSEAEAEGQAPAPAVAPMPEPPPPEEVAEAPEEGVPRQEPETAAEPAPTASPPRFDFTADFEATETAEAPPSTSIPAAEEPVAEPPPEPPPPATEPPPARPAPERVTAPSGELHDALWLMRQDPEYYTIQALGVSSEAAATGFYTRHGSGLEAVIAPTRRAGRDWYVLVIGVFSSAEQARQAIASLPAPIQRNQPFIRRIGDIQEAILAAR